MVTLTIDKQTISCDEHLTIMEAAKLAHIDIPHLCYLKGINDIGACRVCVVELEGKNKLITACNTVVRDGMVLFTNSPKVRDTRRTNIQLILSQHDCECAYCSRSGNCSLQTISNDLGITKLPYEKHVSYLPWNPNFPLIREANKCIKCMRCIQICDKIQNLQVWDVSGTGSRTTVNVSNNRKIEDADCSLCGQCITHCPVNALHVREDTETVFDAFNDPNKITVVQIAPAVRVAWGEQLGLSREEATIERLACAFKKMGADYVFDTDFAADLTIMEEANEFLERFTHGELKEMPMFTSCCPGWVRFLKSQFPEYVPYLSTSKSPHQMFGAITKTYLAQKLNIDPKQLYVISIMPCVAKKHEIELPNMNDSGYKDVDVVLTTREIVRMIRAEHIDVASLQETTLDDPLGTASGAGVIFGATGGVMEAALRSAYYFLTKENAPIEAFKEVRGMEAWKEANFEIQGTTVRTAVVSGLGNTRKLMEAMRRKEVSYDFVEVMACPGGCSGGGGQPIWDGQEMASIRAQSLYQLDDHATLRFSHENPKVQALYDEFLEKPLSPLAERLLHTDHTAWNMPSDK
ncbi:[FeFe] hydrogenase, group A [Amedibacillus sp. YH-ame10]